MKQSQSQTGSPYEFYGKIPLRQAIPLGLQHVLAMFVGNLTPILIICGACGISATSGDAELAARKTPGNGIHRRNFRLQTYPPPIRDPDPDPAPRRGKERFRLANV